MAFGKNIAASPNIQNACPSTHMINCKLVLYVDIVPEIWDMRVLLLLNGRVFLSSALALTY